MLAHRNRVITGDEFKTVVRGGRKIATPRAVVYVTRTASDSPTRFGFILAKTVGPSVTRNRVRRRLRAIGRELLETCATGVDVVIRPLPASAIASFGELRDEVSEAVLRSVVRR